MKKVIYLCTLLFLFVQCDRPKMTETWICDENDYKITLQFYDNGSFYSTTVGDCHQLECYVLFENDMWGDYKIVNDSIMQFLYQIDRDDPGLTVSFKYSKNCDTILLKFFGFHDNHIGYVNTYKFVIK